MKKLVIVTGASGVIGTCYLNYFLTQKNTTCIGISRSALALPVSHLKIDLLNSAAVTRAIQQLDLSAVSQIFLIHAVGRFKYEGRDGKPAVDHDQDGIDDEVFSSNYDTFINVVKPLLKKLATASDITTLTLCAFGSIADKYELPFWASYTHSKNALRTFIQKVIDAKETQNIVRGRFINVSTTDTGNERLLRPYADDEERKYWLKAEKIVEQSVDYIENPDSLQWLEIDIYEPVAGFVPEEYYGNYEAIENKWNRQMGAS
jgi:NADP-dependent 3-hydroxy acid dehydrogenase YdfG